MIVEIDYLRKILDEQCNVIIDLTISINNMHRLNTEKYKYEEQIKNYEFFRHHFYQLGFIAVIQLSKLFSSSKNEKFSFEKMFSVLKNNSYGNSIKELFRANSNKSTMEVKSRVEILDLVQEAEQIIKDNKVLIDKIYNMRNNVYAHGEIDAVVLGVSIDELRNILFAAQHVYNLFQFRVFFTTTNFNQSKLCDVDYILKYMSERRGIYFKEINERLNE